MSDASVRAAAEGMPIINRRKMLVGLAAASTATAAIPAAGAAPAREYPVQRVNRLASDLSQAMDDWMLDLGWDGVPDRWRAVIYPSKDPTPYSKISFEHLPSSETPSDRVARLEAELIEAKKAQYPDVTDWRICRPEDLGTCFGTFFIMGHRPEVLS